MARAPALSRDALIGLGAERLAELALDEAEGNAAFRNLVTAALAASHGAEAVAAIVDRRLGALERAKGAIGSSRVRGFVEDLSATLKIVAGDLARADPDDPLTRRNLSVAFSKLGDVHLKRGEIEQALRAYRKRDRKSVG